MASDPILLECVYCGDVPDATAHLGEICRECGLDGYRLKLAAPLDLEETGKLDTRPIAEALSMLASAVKSGEPWDLVLLDAKDRAFAALLAHALRSGSQPTEEATALRAQLNAAIAYINALVKIAVVASDAWDRDDDSRTGKMLGALAGKDGYRLDLDAARETYHTARASSQETKHG